MPQTELAAYELTFPHGLAADDVVGLLGGIAAELSSGTPKQASFEVSANRSGIKHRLVVDQQHRQLLLRRIRSALPAIRIVETKLPTSDVPPRLAAEVQLSTSHRPLRRDRAEGVSASVLAAINAVRGSERIELQWLISGARSLAPARQLSASEKKRPTTARLLFPPPSTWHSDSDATRAEREKQAEPLVRTLGRIAVWCDDDKRGRALLAGVAASLRSIEAPGVRLRVRLRRSAAKRFVERSVGPLVAPSLVNAAELATLVGWPLESPTIPGLRLGAAKQLPTPHGLAVSEKEGVPLGDSTFPGSKKPLVIRDRDRLQHLHVVGPTGVGKSTLLANMAIGDAERGHGLIVLDPKRDLVSEVLDRIPKSRRDAVVLLDPADTERPVGFNPLDAAGRPPELVVDHLVSVFAGLFNAYWGPRTDDIFRASLLTLATAQLDEPATLLDVPKLLTDARFRRRLVGQIADPVALEPFWGWYESLSESERSHVIGPVFNKLRAFLMRPQIRRMVGQRTPSWNLEQAVAEGQIVLVPLSAGQLGEEASRLLGSLIVARLWQTVQGRASTPTGKRQMTMLYMDEFQDFLHLPTSVGEMLAQARGLGLGITVAHQHLGQLGTATRDDVLASCRSRVAFQMNQRDAKVLAPEMPGVEPQDLAALESFEIFARIASGSSSLATASGRTRPLPKKLGCASEIVAESRQRFGQEIEQPTKAQPVRSKEPTSAWDEVPIGGRAVADSDEEVSNG